jgi:N-methylhydantoinase A/oxoprolinase/acetone carboxylase beta subunit
MSQPARIGVDIGGTFTDVVIEAAGRRHSVKVLTTHEAPEAGVMDGLARVLGAAGRAPGDVGLVLHGTTLATNALIERRGARTALITTQGFRDVLEMRAEDRYEQYDLSIDLPAPLVPRRRRLTVPERIDAQGRVRTALDEDALREAAARMARDRVEAVAVGFLHSYRNPAHEVRAGEVLRAALPGVAVTLSSEVAPEMREYERFSTAAANAYVQPLMAGYLDRLEARLAEAGYDCPLLLMLSGGGLTDVGTARRFPVRLVESGPAGGAAFAADLARRHGLGRVLSYDMGGTTAKLCLIEDGAPRTGRGFEVARVWRFRRGSGLPLRIPVIEMVEIGAGGGSLASLDPLGRIAVGPRSAGSEPGPACYGRGGTGATVTDANVVMGRIAAEGFAGGRMRLDEGAAARALDAAVGGPLGLSPEAAALGIAEMVEEAMSSAARVHAVEEGATLEGRTMIAFGGGAPLHALRMADKLGIDRVLVPAGAGVGSAIGFLRAPVAFEVVSSQRHVLDALDAGAVARLLEAGRARAEATVRRAAGPGAALQVTRKAFMRYVGQGHEIEVPLPPEGAPDADAMRRAFEAAYRALYGRLVEEGVIEGLSWSVTVAAPRPDEPPGEAPRATGAAPGERRVVDPATGARAALPEVARDALAPGATLEGPAVVVEDETTLYLPAAFALTVLGDGTLDCRRRAATSRGGTVDAA